MQKRKQIFSGGEEWVPLVDEHGTVTGQVPRSRVHDGSKLLHPVVHMHVLNPDKAILLQKRPESKLIQPGKWDTAVGGHISAGENIRQALLKEAYEEIGLTNFDARLLKMYKWESEAEAELVYLFVTHTIQNFDVHTPEVDETRFWTPIQIDIQLGRNVFTPNFEYEYRYLMEKGVLD